MPISRRHIQAVKVIGGAAEEVSLTVDGDISWENGEYEVFPHRDTIGDFTAESPSRGQMQETTWTLVFKMRGFPDPAAATVGALTETDVAMRTPKFLSLVTSTASSGTACPDAESIHTLQLTLDDCAAGTDTIAFEKSRWTGSVSVSAEGNQITMSGTSYIAKPTFT